MTDDMLHVTQWHFGEKAFSPFSETEMARRQAAMRQWMAINDIDAALLTSHHGINYHSGWLYCAFGRRYGMVIDHENATTISSGIDGGQPWRRSFGDNITYSDWRRDNFFSAIRQLTRGARRIGIEWDHVSLEFRQWLAEALPGVDFIDVGQAMMWMRTIKSVEELELMRQGARIAGLGMAAGVQAIAAGVPEHEIAIAATNAMTRAIAQTFPFVELMDSWTWFQSGINTDGAHNPVTNRVIHSGDILSLNARPMVFGYNAALQRTLFCAHCDEASLSVWEKNVAVHQRGLALIKSGARCRDIALELNGMYREWDLLKYRSFGYGHSLGVLCHYYGRESGVELREDVDTILEPGMVISMEPMVMVPDGLPGAGGYREQDIVIVTEDGAEIISTFPVGPEHNIIGR